MCRKLQKRVSEDRPHAELHTAGRALSGLWILTPWAFPEPQKGVEFTAPGSRTRGGEGRGSLPFRVMDDPDAHFSCIC